jgi:hypothetical protein
MFAIKLLYSRFLMVLDVGFSCLQSNRSIVLTHPRRWSKELWLELARCVGEVDLLGLIELMEQKGLRIIAAVD